MVLDGVARHLGGRPVKGRDLIALSVEFQARAVGAKAVGEDQIAAGGQERGVRGAHRLAARHVPNLRTVPGGQTLCEKTGAETAVGQKPTAPAKQAIKTGHRLVRHRPPPRAPPAMLARHRAPDAQRLKQLVATGIIQRRPVRYLS